MHLWSQVHPNVRPTVQLCTAAVDGGTHKNTASVVCHLPKNVDLDDSNTHDSCCVVCVYRGYCSQSRRDKKQHVREIRDIIDSQIRDDECFFAILEAMTTD